MAKPSAFRAVVEVNGAAQAAHNIQQIGKRARDTLPLMEELVGVLQMQQERRVTGYSYAPIKENTAARKAKEGEDPALFRDERRRIRNENTRTPDAMYQALTQKSYPGQLKHFTRTLALFGLKSAGQGPFFYVRFVQNVKGTKRRILAISADDAMILTGWVEKYIMGPLAAERLGASPAARRARSLR